MKAITFFVCVLLIASSAAHPLAARPSSPPTAETFNVPPSEWIIERRNSSTTKTSTVTTPVLSPKHMSLPSLPIHSNLPTTISLPTMTTFQNLPRMDPSPKIPYFVKKLMMITDLSPIVTPPIMSNSIPPPPITTSPPLILSPKKTLERSRRRTPQNSLLDSETIQPIMTIPISPHDSDDFQAFDTNHIKYSVNQPAQTSLHAFLYVTRGYQLPRRKVIGVLTGERVPAMSRLNMTQNNALLSSESYAPIATTPRHSSQTPTVLVNVGMFVQTRPHTSSTVLHSTIAHKRLKSMLTTPHQMSTWLLRPVEMNPLMVQVVTINRETMETEIITPQLYTSPVNSQRLSQNLHQNLYPIMYAWSPTPQKALSTMLVDYLPQNRLLVDVSPHGPSAIATTPNMIVNRPKAPLTQMIYPVLYKKPLTPQPQSMSIWLLNRIPMTHLRVYARPVTAPGTQIDFRSLSPQNTIPIEDHTHVVYPILYKQPAEQPKAMSPVSLQNPIQIQNQSTATTLIQSTKSSTLANTIIPVTGSLVSSPPTPNITSQILSPVQASIPFTAQPESMVSKLHKINSTLISKPESWNAWPTLILHSNQAQTPISYQPKISSLATNSMNLVLTNSITVSVQPNSQKINSAPYVNPQSLTNIMRTTLYNPVPNPIASKTEPKIVSMLTNIIPVTSSMKSNSPLLSKTKSTVFLSQIQLPVQIQAPSTILPVTKPLIQSIISTNTLPFTWPTVPPTQKPSASSRSKSSSKAARQNRHSTNQARTRSSSIAKIRPKVSTTSKNTMYLSWPKSTYQQRVHPSVLPLSRSYSVSSWLLNPLIVPSTVQSATQSKFTAITRTLAVFPGSVSSVPKSTNPYVYTIQPSLNQVNSTTSVPQSFYPYVYPKQTSSNLVNSTTPVPISFYPYVYPKQTSSNLVNSTTSVLQSLYTYVYPKQTSSSLVNSTTSVPISFYPYVYPKQTSSNLVNSTTTVPLSLYPYINTIQTSSNLASSTTSVALSLYPYINTVKPSSNVMNSTTSPSQSSYSYDHTKQPLSTLFRIWTLKSLPRVHNTVQLNISSTNVVTHATNSVAPTVTQNSMPSTQSLTYPVQHFFTMPPSPATQLKRQPARKIAKPLPTNQIVIITPRPTQRINGTEKKMQPIVYQIVAPSTPQVVLQEKGSIQPHVYRVHHKKLTPAMCQTSKKLHQQIHRRTKLTNDFYSTLAKFEQTSPNILVPSVSLLQSTPNPLVEKPKGTNLPAYARENVIVFATKALPVPKATTEQLTTMWFLLRDLPEAQTQSLNFNIEPSTERPRFASANSQSQFYVSRYQRKRRHFRTVTQILKYPKLSTNSNSQLENYLFSVDFK